MRSVILLTIVLAGIALVAVPTGSSEHCHSRMTVYSRASFAPTPATPHHPFDRNVCESFRQRGIETHTLAPNADQIMIRVGGFFSLPTLAVDLDGMGFDDVEYTLVRIDETGGPTYQLPEWVFIPDPTGATLSATVHYPAESFTVTYARNQVQLPLPPLPPFEEPQPPTV